jgi:hypothetical protein
LKGAVIWLHYKHRVGTYLEGERIQNSGARQIAVNQLHAPARKRNFCTKHCHKGKIVCIWCEMV